MRTAVLLLNFGEPEHATMDTVVPFLERIFTMNSSLEGAAGQQARERARQLAAARAPGLIEEYETIGGSPLHAQAQEQVELLEAELQRRGHDAVVILGMQFTPPFIADAVKRARAAGADRIVALPVYPLSGPSTTVAALERLEQDMRLQLWSAPVHSISGWHRAPGYLELRAQAVQQVLDEHGLSFSDVRTRLVFSAHGTPVKYLDEGSRYDIYVRDYCADMAARLGAAEYVIGYQNHTNRPIEWTQPDIDSVIDSVDADRVVVEAVSFMHEQSETLAELDHELRERAEQRGLQFYRVPVPHAAPAFIAMLADLVEGAIGTAPVEWQSCRCRPGALCLNASI